MKRRIPLMLGMLIALAAIVLSACCPPLGQLTVPTVGYIPQDWYLSDEEAYPNIVDQDGTHWGLIEYTDQVDYDFVQIYYGEMPSELIGHENDANALIDRAIYESVTFDPEETGTILIGSRLAGYAKAYDPSYEIYDMEIVFIIDSTCIDIYTVYDATSEDEAQAMSLIDSIRP